MSGSGATGSKSKVKTEEDQRNLLSTAAAISPDIRLKLDDYISRHFTSIFLAQGPQRDKQPTPEDALAYLDSVRTEFCETDITRYERFVAIMSEFKSMQIDTLGVIERVSALFCGHPALIEGFNTFLPPGYRMECSADPSKSDLITVIAPFGTYHPGNPPKFLSSNLRLK